MMGKDGAYRKEGHLVSERMKLILSDPATSHKLMDAVSEVKHGREGSFTVPPHLIYQSK